MAKANRKKTGKTARRLTTMARACLSPIINALNAVPQFFLLGLQGIANLPVLRRSILRRKTVRLWHRFILRVSDGYNFEEFFRTQHGVGQTPSGTVEAELWQLPGQHLLDLAHNVEQAERGATAMRVLVERALRQSERRSMSADRKFVVPVLQDPNVYVPNIHTQWRGAIETAFASQRSAPPARRVTEQPRARMSYWDAPPGEVLPAPCVVEDDATFELSVPELVPYRASTRH